MILSRLRCAFLNRHKPIRSKVYSDGGRLVGNCRYCGKSIRRLAPKLWKHDAGGGAA